VDLEIRSRVPDRKAAKVRLAADVTECSGAMSNLAHPVSCGSRIPSQEVFGASPCWYAIQTWPQHERKVAAEFQRKDIEVFLPLLSSKRQWSDRRQVVQLPLFPSYVFVRIGHEPSARIPVLRTNGVTGFVGIRGRGVSIPDSEIESVRLLLTRGVTFQQHPFLDVGQRVRIRGGSLDGVEGVLLAKHDDLSLLVSIKIIQRSLAVRVAGYRIERI
jgi:transcription antitermination factor NusG